MRIKTVCGLVTMLLASGSAFAEPAATSDKVVAARLDDDVGNVVVMGRPWGEIVPKVVAILGEPNFAVKDRLDWILVSDLACYQYMLVGDGDFVKSSTYDSTGFEVDGFAACKAKASKHAKVPAIPPARVVDVDGLASQMLTRWGTGQFQAIFDAAHPEFQKSVGTAATLGKVAEQATSKAGKFVKLEKPAHESKQFGWFVQGTAVFENRRIMITMGFRMADGKPRLIKLDFPNP